MSIKYNGKLIAGKYKTQIVTDATENNKGLIRIATLEEINAGTDNTTAVTPKGLATKQNKLTAGTGIEILPDGTINNTQTSAEWGNITGTITDQLDLQTELNKKVDKVEGKSLIEDAEIERLKTLKNYDDTQIKTDITNINSALETKASTTDLENALNKKVDKVEGKSLIEDAEIERLATLKNYDDTQIKSSISNLQNTKQNKLTAGTGIDITNNIISNTQTSAEWGNIQGDLSSQTDLQNALNNRANKDLSNLSTTGESKLNNLTANLANNSLSNLSEEGQAKFDSKTNIDLNNLTDTGKTNLKKISQEELNNPYSFGDSKYSPIELNNISWLKSNGQWNAKAVYPDYYNWILENVNNGVEGFKTTTGYAYKTSDQSYTYWIATYTPVVGMSVYDGDNSNTSAIVKCGTITSLVDGGFIFTDSVYANAEQTVTRYADSDKDIVTDYDFVLNITDETFRLPLLDGSEDLPAGDYFSGITSVDISSILTGSPSNYRIKQNGFINGACVATTKGEGYFEIVNTSTGCSDTASYNGGWGRAYTFGRRGDRFSFYYGGNGFAIRSLDFIPAIGNGDLYYYVGETVKNSTIIDVSDITTALSNKLDQNQIRYESSTQTLYIGM